MTADDRSFAPPHELVGPLGQVIDVGGGVVPLLTPAPAPGALATASPGVSTAAPLASAAAAAPGPLSAMVPGDPSVLTAMARMANELFGAAPATSVAPVPVSQATALTPSNVQLPVSPGISPMLVAEPPAAMPPGLPASIGPAGAPAWPFSVAPDLGSLMAEVLRLPILGDVPAGAPAYFVPASDAVGLETDRGRGIDSSTYEVRAEPALVRDLGGAAFDPYALRRDFPILEERVHGGKRLVWLDNAATTQKPRAVIDRLSYFYEHENSNIHRAAHVLAARATDAYEAGRESARRFLNAGSAGEIIFVRGATEGINLIAQSWGRRHVEAGDEIVITHLEHHANIVPWQQLCQATGARLRVAPVDDRGDVILEAYERLLGPRTRLVAFPQVSNALGTVTPAREMIEIAHRYGAVVALDGAQAVSHMRVDVQLLDCDFYVLSGHKVFAPTGIGVVYGKRAVLDAMPPWQGGGNMIQDVTFERTTYQPPPGRFEAGTGSIADAVGLGAALDYVTRVGIDRIERYEHDLLAYADRRLATVPGLAMIGAPRDKAGVLSFVLDGQRTEDVGSALDKEGIAVRSGHHCAQPILRRLGVEATVRASLAFYNVCEDIDALVEALYRLAARR
ncbi:MAG: SufS family cysteine desulfurase [Deltaproteobacteria bacterium]|nr:MAG: SufS family cysteine desulfurase [Deltaproteobacteria bacterium]TMQ20346.1 MAG: SufS family cysteine desulfurase [Deltaproteobacteria bacterium]